MIRIGIAGLWHVHAPGYIKTLQARSEVEIVAVYDDDLERGKKAADELGVPYYWDMDTFARLENMDAAMVCTATMRHGPLMIALANNGKHIFTEKCLTVSLDECREVVDAVKKAGIKFCISFPQRCRKEFQYAHDAALRGDIGRVTFMRVRIAHDGTSSDWLPPHFYEYAETGGGAMMDLGAHPMYLSSWILGKPKKITSMFNAPYMHLVEENAACLIEFENGAICCAETGFVSKGCPDTIQIYGTEGMIEAGGLNGGVTVTAKVGDAMGTFRPNLGPKDPSPLDQFVDRLVDGGEMPFGIEDAAALTQLMDGAYIAHESGEVYKF